MRIRCSALPRLFKCPASKAEPAIEVQSSDPAARMGTAVHEVMAKMVQRSVLSVDVEYCKLVGDKYGFTDDQQTELQMLAHCGAKTARPILEMLTGWKAEKDLEISWRDFTLTGHPDMIGESVDGWVIIDWKTGRDIGQNYWDQLKGYAVLNAADHGAMDDLPVKLVIVWCREQQYEVRDFTPDDHLPFLDRINYAIVRSNAYSTGSQCAFCPLQTTCPARMDALGDAMAALEPTKRVELSPAQLGDLWERAGLVSRAVEQYKAMVKQVIEAQGSITCSDGSVLSFRESERDKLRPDVTIHELTKYYGVNTDDTLMRFLDALSISKSEMATIISKHAPRGEKGKRVDEILEAIKSKGGIETTTIKTIYKETPAK